jgi:hypothetical protein
MGSMNDVRILGDETSSIGSMDGARGRRKVAFGKRPLPGPPPCAGAGDEGRLLFLAKGAEDEGRLSLDGRGGGAGRSFSGFDNLPEEA